MVTNLRKSIDMALAVENLLKIQLAGLGLVISTEPALEDSLVVFIAEAYNQTVAQIVGLSLQIESITEQMKLFGETGLEKELAFVPKEIDDEAT